jgi:hypothetical protein
MKDKKYYESLDKRSKEYKTYKKSLGLGDVVEAITEATGIKKVVKAIFGDDCGCNERKELLNKIHLPVKYKAYRCFTKEQYNAYAQYVSRRTIDYDAKDVSLLITLFAHVFAIQYNQQDLCVNCSGSYKIIKNIEDKLDIVFNEYTKELNEQTKSDVGQ